MKVLVDTSVWTLALRRAAVPDGPEVTELRELVREGGIEMIGAVRQELLSGMRESTQFEMLRTHLRAFPDLELSSAEFELAAECCNRCRAAGVQGSATDFLLCAVAISRGLAIMTTDGDFLAFARVLSFPLHSPRGG